ncbi:probable acyl-[acyl-carrier-protein]--UDP-N-acetylglucosamine O-acyltransferase, mitochondrial isoform X2 [Cucumis sativus]|uniref:probable acyl-[acyl-carrier-protein]--UDP-N-acetylglucosamine O-acyltransferase, mitochondrial isoform X2 n=1 Tax=Cucumis sativus TaxID=3659 RepID=UPI0012F5070D|nr:probable acyl-[acyl-carrier-protein]--UDP-N-acetylglucosamine O-acyltransferase, mitochondrial isoform X2 [Cucumis sativus]XP_031736350.1 probable acyl-[acyl-carrier-protein]--UDP-N-acetylglucosamine O-acyltransferase, mitochondrial isoform X2 [Cucumis sativus]
MRNILWGERFLLTLILRTNVSDIGYNPTLSSLSLRRPFLRQRGLNTPSVSLNFPPMHSLFKPRRSFCSLNHFYRSSTFISGDATSETTVGRSSTLIHPTAVVHPNAVIGEDGYIGPFCTVGAFAKLGNGCQLYPGSHIFGCTELGDRCVLMTGAIVGEDIPGRTVIGCNNKIGHHAVVGIRCQDMKYKPGDECFLDIGDNNDIREHSSVHRSSKSSDVTAIGDNNLIMGSCHIAHDCKIGNNNIFANNTLLAGHVVVEDYVHTGGTTAVHQFCHVGSFSFVAAGSMVSQDVPKYMMVGGERPELRGLNLEGLRRNGFTVEEDPDHWLEICIQEDIHVY